jgi:hypothetical protein
MTTYRLASVQGPRKIVNNACSDCLWGIGKREILTEKKSFVNNKMLSTDNIVFLIVNNIKELQTVRDIYCLVTPVILPQVTGVFKL